MTRVAGPWMSGSVSGKKRVAEAVAPRSHAAEVVVELLGDVAGQLEVLLLVVADRHVRRAVERGCRAAIRIG